MAILRLACNERAPTILNRSSCPPSHEHRNRIRKVVMTLTPIREIDPHRELIREMERQSLPG
jgi:hypothetical protein